MPRMRAMAVPTLVDNTPLVVQVLDQGPEGSCVLNGWAEAIQSEMWREAGRSDPPPELPSRQFMYFAARAIDGSGPTDDVGTCSASAAQALALYGFCRESDWRYIAGELDPGSRLEALKKAAYDQRFHATARVDSDTMSVAECDAAIASALTAGYLLPYATDVDTMFENLMPGQIWPGPRGRSLGGHCTTIVGRGPANQLCRYTQSTEIVLKILNSWGLSFCDSGYYLMAVGALSQRYDVYAATRTPTYSDEVQ